MPHLSLIIPTFNGAARLPCELNCGGSDQRFLLPASALGGGALLLAAAGLVALASRRRA